MSHHPEKNVGRFMLGAFAALAIGVLATACGPAIATAPYNPNPIVASGSVPDGTHNVVYFGLRDGTIVANRPPATSSSNEWKPNSTINRKIENCKAEIPESTTCASIILQNGKISYAAWFDLNDNGEMDEMNGQLEFKYGILPFYIGSGE
jgi:hypothetical protein